MDITIRVLGQLDVERVLAAAHLFDRPPLQEATELFLRREGHHLLIAYLGDDAVGFVSGVEMTHPDKGTEMMLYELGVDAPHRKRGIGRSLVDALARLATDHGCYGMWVPLDAGNPAAVATYRSAGATEPEDGATMSWSFGETGG